MFTLQLDRSPGLSRTPAERLGRVTPRSASHRELENQSAQRLVSAPTPCRCLLCPRPPLPQDRVGKCPGQLSGHSRNSS